MARKKKKKEPCETYKVSYIKVTYDKDGNVTSTTVKYVINKAK